MALPSEGPQPTRVPPGRPLGPPVTSPATHSRPQLEPVWPECGVSGLHFWWDIGPQRPVGGVSRFTCHLQPSRQTDSPQEEEKNVLGEGGHGGQKLAAWNLPFLPLLGGSVSIAVASSVDEASRWQSVWTRPDGTRRGTLRRALIWGGASLGET